MQRRQFLSVLAAATVVGPTAFAQSYSDQIVAHLTEQGFQNITVARTLLGRIRILAQFDAGWREIILNPNTGEILRELWTDLDGNPIAPRFFDFDDDDDDDESDDDSDDGSDDDSDDEPDDDDSDDRSDDSSGEGGGGDD